MIVCISILVVLQQNSQGFSQSLKVMANHSPGPHLSQVAGNRWLLCFIIHKGLFLTISCRSSQCKSCSWLLNLGNSAHPISWKSSAVLLQLKWSSFCQSSPSYREIIPQDNNKILLRLHTFINIIFKENAINAWLFTFSYNFHGIFT